MSTSHNPDWIAQLQIIIPSETRLMREMAYAYRGCAEASGLQKAEAALAVLSEYSEKETAMEPEFMVFLSRALRETPMPRKK